ncbi:uncharacterized protein CcaverHIS019_0301340 [Cutaneotrichosporon cavernicola]|uniref:Uncharacterized protein n=1 Tax=Cutaneotrichosporon cavernicola TaxID=279322 RepID=A0AA48KZ44_9TREE|nr:uncharacterized protein CcaverHIS019_0301340 [Cutaneotrichosporon cavernicola]BEI90064.1 hypothetical protein CcaverHIS019_0301340 [Cutaneotrichosporon cavernicola]
MSPPTPLEVARSNFDPVVQLEKLQANVNDIVANAYACRRAAAKADVQLGGGLVSAGYADGMSWEDEAQRWHAVADKAQEDVATLKSRIVKLESDRKADLEAFNSLVRNNDVLKAELAKLSHSADTIKDIKTQLADAMRTIDNLKAELSLAPPQEDAIRISPALRKRMTKQACSVSPTTSSRPPSQMGVSRVSAPTPNQEEVLVQLPTKPLSVATVAGAVTNFSKTAKPTDGVGTTKAIYPPAQVAVAKSSNGTQVPIPSDGVVASPDRSNTTNSPSPGTDRSGSTLNSVPSYSSNVNQTAASVSVNESKAPTVSLDPLQRDVRPAYAAALSVKSPNAVDPQFRRRLGFPSSLTPTKPPAVAEMHKAEVKPRTKQRSPTTDCSSSGTLYRKAEPASSVAATAHAKANGKTLGNEAKPDKGKKKTMRAVEADENRR